MKKISQKNLCFRFEQALKKSNLIKPRDKIIVAISGGADSVCLLELLLKIKDKHLLDISACHYNHKIRGEESDRDQLFVTSLCQKRGVELICGVNRKKSIKSEQEAREARYDFFKKILTKNRGAKIATAHNSLDLAETLLFRVIRGSGMRGLKSIPRQRKNFIRPLLQFSKDEILSYLKSEGCDFCFDSSNLDQNYTRNKIRHSLIPKILEINPNFLATSQSLILSIEDDYDYLNKISYRYFRKIASFQDGVLCINRDDFNKLDISIKRMIILISAKEVGQTKDITFYHLNKLIEVSQKNQNDKILPLPHSLLVRFKNGKIYLSIKTGN